jgi:hypothetical protein
MRVFNQSAGSQRVSRRFDGGIRSYDDPMGTETVALAVVVLPQSSVAGYVSV